MKQLSVFHGDGMCNEWNTVWAETDGYIDYADVSEWMSACVSCRWSKTVEKRESKHMNKLYHLTPWSRPFPWVIWEPEWGREKREKSRATGKNQEMCVDQLCDSVGGWKSTTHEKKTKQNRIRDSVSVLMTLLMYCAVLGWRGWKRKRKRKKKRKWIHEKVPVADPSFFP